MQRILVVWLVAGLWACGWRGACAQSVAPDGAVGINARWERGSASTWWIEEQRAGADYVTQGIHQENPALIQQGLTILDWGFRHEGSDGSFPGTAGGSVPAAFHSTSLFAEAAARAALALAAYQPCTYALPAGTYTGKIAAYAGSLHATAQWLMQPSVARSGQAYNAAYTHRRWLLASALAQIGALTGDRAISTAATPYVSDGLQQQLGAGWRAAVVRAADGSYPPAILLPPGQSPPANAVRVISAAGVNPERFGYDVSYQAVGVLQAARYLGYCADSRLQAAVTGMIASALQWESQRIGPDGAVDVTGSSRVGIEVTRDGNIKKLDVPAVIAAFQTSQPITADLSYTVEVARVSNAGVAVDPTPVAADGAIGGNFAWEQGQAATWSISLQQVGIAWVVAGVQRENDALLRKGIGILDWGWARQAADGSFGSTQSPFDGASAFVAAAARAVLLLQQFRPVTYTPDQSYYQAVVARYKRQLRSAAGWLTNPGVAQPAWPATAASCSRCYRTALALQEVATLASAPKLATAAAAYARAALAQQSPAGINPENGASDVSLQAAGIGCAGRYCQLADPSLQPALAAMIAGGMEWEMDRMRVDGSVAGASNPNYAAIADAFTLAARITADPRFTVVATRIEANQLP